MHKFALPFIASLIFDLGYAVFYYAGSFLGSMWAAIVSNDMMTVVLLLNVALIMAGVVIFAFEFRAERKRALRASQLASERARMDAEEKRAKQEKAKEFESWMAEAATSAQAKETPKGVNVEEEVFQKQRAKIEDMIKNAKFKYTKREIDEPTFRELMKEYNKQLIELEAEYHSEKPSVNEL